MYDYKDDNKVIIGIIVIGIVCVIAWICHDLARNKPIYGNTDTVLDTIEVTVGNAENRIDSITDGLGKAESSVIESANAVGESRKDADAIASGINECQKRVDGLIQRHGNIENLIADIETINRQRTQSTQTPSVAK